MHLTDKEDTLDLLCEVEKWYEEDALDLLCKVVKLYEDTNNKDEWVSCFTNNNLKETLLELDDYILSETSDTLSQNSTIASSSICNTRSQRCLINDFEMFSSAFDCDVPPLCSTPLSRKEHEIEELRLINQSVSDEKRFHTLIHQETIQILDVSPSFLSSSLESVSLTELNIKEVHCPFCNL